MPSLRPNQSSTVQKRSTDAALRLPEVQIRLASYAQADFPEARVF